MTNFNVQAFMDSLSAEMQEKVKACKTAEELAAFIEANNIDLTAFADGEEDVELSPEDLEDVTGGKGFLQAAIASIIMFTSVGAVIASPSSADGTIFTSNVIVVSADAPIDGEWAENMVNWGWRKGADKAIDKGLSFIVSKIPFVGDMFGDTIKDMLGGLLKDALGLTEQQVKQMSIEDLSEQVSELAEKMDTMKSELESHMDAQTWRLIQEIENQSVLSAYKQGMYNLSINGSSNISELKELNKLDDYGNPKYNDDEKLWIIAATIGNSDTWGTEGIIFNLKAVGGYLSGSNYLSDKDFYTVLCNSGVVQHDCLFADEAQAACDVYTAKMMQEYLASYAISMEALQAQRTILEAVKNGDTDTFNPDNLSYSYKKQFDNFTSTPSKIDSTISDLGKMLCGKEGSDKPTILSKYEEFSSHSGKNYINGGEENTQLVFDSLTVKGDGDYYTNIYKSNYLTGDKLSNLLNACRTANMTIEQYLTAHNQTVPEDAQYVIVGETEKKDEKIKNTVTYDKHTDTAKLIDIRDPKLQMQEIQVYSRTTYVNHVYIPVHDELKEVECTAKELNVMTIQSVVTESNPFGALRSDGNYSLTSGTYMLGKDIYTNGTIVVKEGQTVTIDLNGHTINRGLTKENTDHGSVFAVLGTGTLKIVDSSLEKTGKITGGYAVNGGAIYIYEKGSAELKDVTITENKATNVGGAIFNQGKLVMSGTKIISNEAKDGGGIYNDGTLIGKDAFQMRHNKSNTNGGGAISNHGTMDISGGFEICNNTAPGRGGAIWSSGTAAIDGGTIKANWSATSGGGIAVSTGTQFKMTNCLITGNQASQNGGGYYQDDGDNNQISNCTFTDNSCSYNGGAIYILIEEGKKYSKGFSIKTDNCTIKNNKAGVDGGGIYAFRTFKDGSLRLDMTNSEISGNTCGSRGGGVFCQATLYFTGVNITGNSATEGGGFYNHKVIFLTDCNVKENTATAKGGGILTTETRGDGYTGNTRVTLNGNTDVDYNHEGDHWNQIWQDVSKANVFVEGNAHVGGGWRKP